MGKAAGMGKVIAIVAALFLIAALVAVFVGVPDGAGDPLVLFSDGHEHHQVGGWLGWLIAGFVMLLVGAILIFVFAGVSVLLVVVAILTAFVLLLALVPVLIPVAVILAIPVFAIYGMVKALS